MIWKFWKILFETYLFSSNILFSKFVIDYFRIFSFLINNFIIIPTELPTKILLWLWENEIPIWKKRILTFSRLPTFRKILWPPLSWFLISTSATITSSVWIISFLSINPEKINQEKFQEDLTNIYYEFLNIALDFNTLKNRCLLIANIFDSVYISKQLLFQSIYYIIIYYNSTILCVNGFDKLQLFVPWPTLIFSNSTVNYSEWRKIIPYWKFPNWNQFAKLACYTAIQHNFMLRICSIIKF